MLSDLQHGFRKRRTCETQLMLTVKDFANSLNNRGQTDAVLLDFSKAFDKVPHRRLLLKLSYSGVRGQLLSWIDNFLSGRTQSVILEGQCSQHSAVTSGVPQGTVIGPLLFLVYINDLPDCVKSQVRLFADDAFLYREISNQADCEQLQSDLQSLEKWEDKWQMSFNADKCHVIRFTNKRLPIIRGYTIHDHVLEVVPSAKYLGVTLDPKLNWNAHIASTCLKANRTRGFLQRNTQHCPQHVKETCYRTFVRPFLEYASPVWDPHTKKGITQLESVQRRCARYVTKDYRYSSSVTAMMNTLGWPLI